MAATTSTSIPFQKESTFSTYNHQQGKVYAENRRNYDPSVYQTIIDHHTSTGGKLDTVLDVGCGPGLATFTLASHFSQAIGLDPSDGMLSNARAIATNTDTGNIRFEVSTAEEVGSNLSPPIADSSIDLITAANAAHWFDIRGFWPSAARVLKPGGTVALWCSGPILVHPSVPNAEKIQAAIDAHYNQYLLDHEVHGSLLTRDRYSKLLLPWNLDPPVTDFDEGTFFRREWQDGERFFTGATEADLDTYEKMLATSSAVTRWRQAHADLVGTEQDVIRIIRREMERLLHEAGVEKGKEKLSGVVRGVVLMVKKRG